MMLSFFIVFAPVFAQDRDCHLRLSIPLKDEGASFSPLDLNLDSAVRLMGNVYGTLLHTDNKGNLKPLIAKSWKIDSDNNSILFDIDQSCRWSDGMPITAKDMVDGIRLLYKNKEKIIHDMDVISSSASEEGKQSPDINVISPFQFRVGYSGDYTVLLSMFTLPIVTPVPNHKLKENPGIWPSKKLLGFSSGSYYASTTNDNLVELVKNPYYCDSHYVQMDSISIYTDLLENQLAFNLISDKVDFIARVPYRYIKSFDGIKDNKFRVSEFSSYDHRSAYYLFINQFNKRLTDPRVKEAIKLTIDHDFILSSNMLGSPTKLLNSYFKSIKNYNSPVFDHGDADYAKRLVKAKKLMREAGYSEENKLQIDMPLRENHYFYATAKAISGMLGQVYFDPRTREAGAGEYYYSNIDNKKFDIALFFWGADHPDPSNIFEGILDKQIAPDEIHFPLVDKLNHSYTITDQQERYSLLESLEKDIRDLGFIIPLYSFYEIWVARKEFSLGSSGVIWGSNIEKKGCEKS